MGFDIGKSQETIVKKIQVNVGRCKGYAINKTLLSSDSNIGVKYPRKPCHRVTQSYNSNLHLFAAAPTETSLGCIVFIE
jgi:hypothetical protein